MPNSRVKKSVYTDKICMSGRSAIHMVAILSYETMPVQQAPKYVALAMHVVIKLDGYWSPPPPPPQAVDASCIILGSQW